MIEVGSSSLDIRISAPMHVEGESLPVPEWQSSSWYNTVLGVPTREEWEMLMGHSIPPSCEPRRGEFTMDNSCLEMKKYSLLMRVQYMVTKRMVAKGIDGKKDMSNPSYRMMLTTAVDCPMRCAVISSGGILGESLARGMVMMANGKPIRGIIAMMKK